MSANISLEFETKNETVPASLHLDNVVLFQCAWILNNINLMVTKSDLSSTRFTLNSANNIGTVVLLNSTVGTISAGP